MNSRHLSTACATGALLIALLGTAVPARADAESPHAFTGNVALTTNYMFRGTSQTGNGPAIQGGFNYSYTPLNLNAGIWASNIASEGFAGANLETDFLASWTPTYDKLSLDLGYIRYEYFQTDYNPNNTNEYHLGLGYDLTYVKPKFTASYSDDFYGFGAAWYYDLTVAVPLPYEFTLTGHYGWNQSNNSPNNGGFVDYDDYSVSISREYGGFGFALAWVDRSERDSCVSPFDCGSTAVFTVSKAF
jgi:uncharacterized protein (TIGR02001 family)